MLIVHPSSQCDVCLDAYVWDEETTLRTPYAIPCGHIFCKQCLESVQSEQCPLCRKRFNRENLKKLHMDPPPENDDSAMLQKLIMAWDDEMEVVNVLDEVEQWLQTKESASLVRLKKVQADYQRYKTRKEDDRFKIRRLEKSLSHLQHSVDHDKEMSQATESSFMLSIEELESALTQSQSEVQSLRNQLARMEFPSSRRDKGKGKARETPSYASDAENPRYNPLPAPPMAVPMERYATIAGDTRSSSVEAAQVAAAVEASIHDRRGRNGHPTNSGPSSAGPSRLQDITHFRPTANGHAASGLVGAEPSTAASMHSQASGILGYTQQYVEPPATAPIQSQPGVRKRRSSRPEALPIALDTALSQAQQHASLSSPSRRTRVVPGASKDDRIFLPPAWPPAGSQSTVVHGFPPASAPPIAASAEPQPQRKHRHKSKSRTHRREERARAEQGEREPIAGVTGLGLLDENAEELRNDPQSAFMSGYMEGLNNGFGYGAVRASAPPAPVPVSAPVSRVRFDAVADSRTPPASATPTASNGSRYQGRPQTSRRSTTQNDSPDELTGRLHTLMEDPVRRPAFEHRTSTASSDVQTWGTVTNDSSRRQSAASDLFTTLRSFPPPGPQLSRSSTMSEALVILPPEPLGAESNGSRRVEGRNDAANANVHSPNVAQPDRGLSQSSASISFSTRSDSRSNSNYFGAMYSSEAPTASSQSAARRTNDRQVNQPAANTSTTRPAHNRLTSLPLSSGTTSDNDLRRDQDRDRSSARMAPMPFPASASATGSQPSYSNGYSHNPLPTLPSFGYAPSAPATAPATAPARPPFHEAQSAPVLAFGGPSRASNTLSPDRNALGLELDDGHDGHGDFGDFNGYSSIPAFAAPTPRASHGLFLRSFSYDAEVDAEGPLYR